MSTPLRHALAMLLAATLAAIGLATWQQRGNAADAQAATERLGAEVVHHVTSRFEHVELALRATRGHFMGASGASVTAPSFRSFYDSLDLAREVPGMLGLGLIARVPPASEAAYLRQTQPHEPAGFAIRQLAPHDGERRVIQFVEPLEPNQAALGLDLASEPRRMAATEVALQTGRAILTSPIRLVQTGPGSSMGMLMVLPMTDVVPAPHTQGSLVYTPIEAKVLLDAVNMHDDLLHTDVADVTDAGTAAVDLGLPAAHDVQADAPRVRLRQDLYGRVWQFDFRARPALISAQHHSSAPTVLAAGLAAALGLAGLTWLLSMLRQRGLEGLAERTRLVTMLDHASDAIVGLDLSGQVTLWNHAAEQLFGFAPQQALGKPLTTLTLPPDSADEDWLLFGNARAGKPTPPFEAQRRHRDGRLIDVEISGGPVLDDHGRVVGVVKILRPIADRLAQVIGLKAYGAELEALVAERTAAHEQTSRDLRTILDALPSPVGYWTRDLRCAFGNRALREWWLVDADALPGMQLAQLVGHEVLDRNMSRIQAVLAGEPQSFERTLRGPDGHMHPSLLRYIPDLRDGEVRGFYGLVFDITSLKQAQEQLEQVNAALQERTAQAESANAAKSDFLANTSHEIRTPLNAILGLTYMLQHSDLPEEPRHMVAQIQLAGRSLLRLVSDVLDLAKIEAGQLDIEEKAFFLQRLLEEEAELHGALARAKGLTLNIEADADVGPAWMGDLLRVRQVLDNLLGNAIKFTGSGSVGLRVRLNSAEQGLEFTVTDTGIGISPEALQRLFQPFTQADTSVSRRYGGTGLGLSIVAQLTRLMGGRVSAQSLPGQGSEFTVILPLRPAAGADLSLLATGTAAVRVLLAEDDPIQREGMVRMARSLGWEVDAVGGGLPLIEKALHAAGQGLPFEAVVADWDMPDLDGLTALATLRQQLTEPQVPAAVVVSAHEIEQVRASPHADVADALLVKPVDASALFNAVNSAVGKSQGSRQRLLEGSHIGSLEAIWLHEVRVLVVDDSSLNLEVAQRVLELENARVTCCVSGEAALVLLQRDPQAFDIVLMDVQMPGMGGNETVRQLRCMPGLGSLPVVALTAGVQPRERDDAMAAGADDFLGKPLDPGRLIRCIRRHVERQRTAPIAVLPRPARAMQGVIQAIGISGIEDARVATSLRHDRSMYLSLLRRFMAEFGDVADAPEPELPRRLHKLRGSAQVVGAMALATAAQDLEDAVRATEPGDLSPLRHALAKRWGELADAAQASLAAEAVRMGVVDQLAEMAAARDHVPLDPVALQQWVKLLERQSLDAVKGLTDLESALRAKMTPGDFRALRAAVSEFDFTRALQLIQPLVG